MAATKKYTVVHPVRHDGQLYPVGAPIHLNEKDALRLFDYGVITSGDSAVVVVNSPSAAETVATLAQFNGMSKAELIAHGFSTYGLTLSEADRKEALVASLYDKYLTAYVPAAVEPVEV